MHLIALLNDTFMKTILLIVGGALLKRWPALVNKAVPVILASLSAVIAALSAMFPTVAPGAVPTSFVYGTVAMMPLYASAGFGPHLSSFLTNTLVPVAFAIASHSGPKNTREWLQLGCKLFWEGGRPPV